MLGLDLSGACRRLGNADESRHHPGPGLKSPDALRSADDSVADLGDGRYARSRPVQIQAVSRVFQFLSETELELRLGYVPDIEEGVRSLFTVAPFRGAVALAVIGIVGVHGSFGVVEVVEVDEVVILRDQSILAIGFLLGVVAEDDRDRRVDCHGWEAQGKCGLRTNRDHRQVSPSLSQWRNASRHVATWRFSMIW